MIKHSPASRAYVSQRLRLSYVDWGNESAPPLLLVHGGRDHSRNWDWVADDLRGDYHVFAPDLRGHGDSQWMVGGSYTLIDYAFDVRQLLRQMRTPPVKIIGHSLGGAISLLFAGLYPELVDKVVSIEGMGRLLASPVHRTGEEVASHLRAWISGVHGLSARLPRRYPSLGHALQRMQEVNGHLSEDQARHLTVHGVNQNEDGSYSWKFDNYVRSFAPVGLSGTELASLHGRITCPVLLVNGTESWVPNPEEDGRIRAFRNAEAVSIEGAGHWVHHDRLDEFLTTVRRFLAP